MRTVETRRRSRYVLLVLSLLAVTLITLDSRGVGVFDGIRNTAGDVFAPVGDAFAWVTSPISNAWGGMSDYDDLKAENERLRQRVDELEGGEAEAANAVEQLERLQEQLQIEFVGDIPTQIARIATGPYSNFDTFRTEIDKGSDAGTGSGGGGDDDAAKKAAAPPPAVPPKKSGCGCEVPGAPAPLGFAAVALGLCALAVRRRRG